MQQLEPGSIYTNVTRQKNMLLFRGKTSDGTRIQFKDEYHPTLFATSNKQTKYKDIYGNCVDSIQPGDMSESTEFVYSYSKAASGFKIYGNTNYEYQFIADLFPQKHIDWHQDQLNVVFLDIETQCENGFPEPEKANQIINAITLKCNGIKYVFGLGSYTITDSDCKCLEFDTEEQLLTAFLDTWVDLDPDVIVGWNIRFFDIPYLVNRIKKLLENAADRLSPWRWIKTEKVVSNGEEQQCYELVGIATLDYLELYKKFTFVTRETYKLDHIAEVELGKKKIDWHEKYETLQEFYTKDFQLFMEYNVKDVDLVQELDAKLNLLDMALSIAYLAKVNLEDVYSQIRTWDTIIYNHLRQKNIVIPLKEEHESDHQYAGAYVKDPIIGMHDWIVSYDLTSLYPMLIRFINIGPDTIVDQAPFDREGLANLTIEDLLAKKLDTGFLKKYDLAMGANKHFFRKDHQSFLSELVEEYFTARKNAKNESIKYKKLAEDPNITPTQKDEYKKLSVKFDTRQQALKVNLNSLYGAVGAVWFRYYDVRQAEAITLTGQLAIRWIEKAFNEYLNKSLGTKNYDYVVGVDTDSNYLRLGKLVDKICPGEKDPKKIVAKLDSFCHNVLDDFIDKKFRELGDYLNVYAQTMQMKREAIADRGFWVAKKCYALHVYNSEGVAYAEPKLKIQGIQVQRSSTPKICREELKKAIKIVLTGTQEQLNGHVSEVEQKFLKATPEDISFPRGVNGMEEYSDPKLVYKKGTPIHVRASLVHNKIIREKKLTKKYNLIKEGDKVKFVYLKVPNPTYGNIIAFMGTLPKELDCHRFIDYTIQFDKAFLEPLQGILDSVGWSVKQKASLEDLFA